MLLVLAAARSASADVNLTVTVAMLIAALGFLFAVALILSGFVRKYVGRGRRR